MNGIMKKCTQLISIVAIIITVLLGYSVNAEQTRFVVNGVDLQLQETVIEQGRTYVPVRKLTELLGAYVFWDSKAREVSLDKEGIKVRFFADEKKVIYNEQVVYMDTPLMIRDGISYAPVRFVAEALKYKIFWDASTNTIIINEKATYTVKDGESLEIVAAALGLSIDDLLRWNEIKSDEILQVGRVIYIESVDFTAIDEVRTKAVIKYIDEEIEWLAKIIFTEADGEPYDGLVAVGAVVVNRVISPNFPNKIYDVVFQKSQFTPAMTGKIYNVIPNNASYQAAREALIGVDPTNGALYFYNPKISNSTFFNKKDHSIDIGNHSFFY